MIIFFTETDLIRLSVSERNEFALYVHDYQSIQTWTVFWCTVSQQVIQKCIVSRCKNSNGDIRHRI